MPYTAAHINEGFFDQIDVPQSYLLGLLAADGCVTKHHVTLSQSGNEGHSLVESVKRLLDWKGNILESTPKKGRKVYTLHFTSKRIVDRLAEFGILPRKSLTYQYPESLSVEQAPYFYRGYIDGDGCVGEYKTNSTTYLHISFVGTQAFIDRSNEILPIQAIPIEKRKASNCWELRFNGKKALVLGDWLYEVKPSLPDSKKYLKYVSSNHKYKVLFNSLAETQKERIALASELIMGGMPIVNVAKEVGIAFQTIYKWKNKGLL